MQRRRINPIGGEGASDFRVRQKREECRGEKITRRWLDLPDTVADLKPRLGR